METSVKTASEKKTGVHQVRVHIDGKPYESPNPTIRNVISFSGRPNNRSRLKP